MKYILLISFLNLSFISTAQIHGGFKPNEAKSLIAVCNSYTFLNLYNSDSLIIPKNHHKVYTSDIIGMDNVFQVYEYKNIGIINFRGSTNNPSSWIENFYSAMIPSSGQMKINSEYIKYNFATSPNSAIHSGYALAIVLLAPSIIEQINSLNAKGIYNILITGHSQGGALAHMCRAYLENSTNKAQFPKNKYKTYAFANPMVGNKEFAEEYNNKFTNKNLSYSIVNPKDLIPQLPLNYAELDEKGGLFRKTLSNILINGKLPKLKDLALPLIEPFLTNYINKSNQLINKVISKTNLSIEMPTFVEDINYFPIGTIIEVEPFSVPEDNSIESSKENNTISQHSPYNYYLSILKKYFPKEYNQIDLLVLPKDSN